MTNPLFWLVLSLLFVTISLTIVLAVAVPALRELARAARSAEKLFDTLRREFPPTLEAIRLTGLEISDLTDEVSEGVQSAGQVVKQVDQSLASVRGQAQRVQSGTQSVVTGIRAAWKTLTRPAKPPRRSADRLPPSRSSVEMDAIGSLASRSTARRPPVEASPTYEDGNARSTHALNDSDALDFEDTEYAQSFESGSLRPEMPGPETFGLETPSESHHLPYRPGSSERNHPSDPSARDLTRD